MAKNDPKPAPDTKEEVSDTTSAEAQLEADSIEQGADLLEAVEGKPDGSDGTLEVSREDPTTGIKATLEKIGVAAPTEEAAKPTEAQPTNQPASVINPDLGHFVIQRAKDSTRWLNAMIYGDYGTGKTFLAGSAADIPEMKDILLLSAESGDMTISDKDIDVIKISNYKQLARAYEFLKLHVRFREAGDLRSLAKLQKRMYGLPDDAPLAREDLRQYKTVIIDSISELQKYVMYQLLNIDPQKTKLDEEPTQAQFKEWGQGSEMIRLMVRGLRDLPIHTVFIASVRTKEDEMKRVFSHPNLPGQLASDVQGFLDLVGFYRIANISADANKPQLGRRLEIAPNQRWQAKSRLRSLDGVSVLVNPTMNDLVKGLLK